MSGLPDLTLSADDYTRVSGLLHRTAGIKLGTGKEELVRSRLLCRVKARGLERLGDYLKLVCSGSDQEEQATALDLLTTNETYFFREPKHFDVLRQHAELRGDNLLGYRAWSAACSTGEEPYSIAVVLADKLGINRFEVVASDYSARVLTVAQEGIYRGEATKHIPPLLLSRFFLLGKRSAQGLLRVTPELQQRVRYLRINLMEPLPELGDFDVIFLRNVLIYFDASTRREVVGKLARRLRPSGLLLISHTETLNGLTEELVPRSPSVYQLATGARRDAARPPSGTAALGRGAR